MTSWLPDGFEELVNDVLGPHERATLTTSADTAWLTIPGANRPRILGVSSSLCDRGLLARANVTPRPGTPMTVIIERPKHRAVVDHAPDATVAASVRAAHRLGIAGRLLPAPIRDRQVREWVDHVEAAREARGDATRVLRSILVRSVVRVAIGSRVRYFVRVLARSR